LISGLKEWGGRGKIFVFGQATNILFSDNGFDGLVIKNSIKGIQLNGNNLVVGAGESILDVLSFCKDNSLSGLEWAGGLPGTIGGAVRGNAGAFGGEIKDNIVKVESFNFKTFQEVERNMQKCNFSYRNSIFKTEEGAGEIITYATFSLQIRDKENINEIIEKNLNYRKDKHPLEFPNIGSIFKNVPFDSFDDKNKNALIQFIKTDPMPVVPVAKLIYLSNLMGRRVGDVMISEKHTNFIINLGNGTAMQVKELIGIIKQEVKNKFNIDLEVEIMEV
jgi:UDP-N-acetylmuramate dehydrogenase